MFLRLFESPFEMKRTPTILSLLMLFASVTGGAFTLDIASYEAPESGRGPHSIFLPGYGEVVFESGLDGVLVVNSAYASTERVEPPVSIGRPAPMPPGDEVAVDGEPGFLMISNRNPESTVPATQLPLHPADESIQNPAGEWNAVPEAASAALGLIGTLLLLARRRSSIRSDTHAAS